MAGGLSIPEYQTPQVAPTTPLQAPNISSTPDAFGGQSGTQLQQAGARLDQGADALQRWALREQGLHNEAAAKDADAALSNDMRALLFDPTKGYFAQRGRGAIDGAKPTLEAIDQLQQKYRASLGSPDAQRMFRDVAEQRVRAVNDQVARHVTAETRTWLDQASVARQTALTNDIPGAINDPVMLDKTIAAKVAEARQHAEDAKLPQEAIDQAGLKAQSEGLKIATLSKLPDARSALSFFQQNINRFDAEDRIALETRLKSVKTDVEADDYIARGSGNGPQISAIHANVRTALAAKGIVLPEPTSEKRTQDQNDAVGGARDSQHLHGKAIDVPLAGLSEAQQQTVLEEYLSKPGVGGVGFYPGSHIHIDARAGAKVFFGPSSDKAGANSPQWVKDKVAAWQARPSAPAAEGFDKANVQAFAQKVLNDPSISTELKAAIYGKIERQSSVAESYRASQIKGLDDLLEKSTLVMITSPRDYIKGTLAQIAEGQEQAGDKSKAHVTRILAANEDFLLGFAQTPDSGQKRIIETLLPGKTKALAAGILAADTKSAGEAAKAAREELSGLKEAATAKLNLSLMGEKAKKAVDFAVRANDPVLVGNIVDFYESHVRGQSVGRAAPIEQQQLIEQLRAKAQAGARANVDIEAVNAAQQIVEKQRAEFAKDAWTAGTQLYPEVGSPKPIADLPGRVAQANLISRNRGNIPVIPFSATEIETIRRQIDEGAPQQQAATMQQLSSLPSEMIPHVAAALAGKHDAGDPLSRGYAAALSFYADKTPETREIADKILRGSRIIKEMANSARPPPASADGWQQALQDNMGTVFRDVSEKVPAIFADAIAAVYTADMHTKGKQGEKLDTGVLDKAIETVMGKPVTRNGQAFFPPVRGMDSYGVDAAMRKLIDPEVAGLKTTNGDPIDAARVRAFGILTNSGQEGVYFVRLPDPAANLAPRIIMDPRTGKEWRLDLRPLVKEARAFPDNGRPVEDETPTGMRRDTGRRYAPRPTLE